MQEDQETLIQIMTDHAFATLVTTDESGLPVATQLPFLIVHDKNTIKLQAHLAKKNPQWQHLEKNNQVLVIFNGPHCYISPSWYQEPGVPTWDYVTVHAYGTAQIFKDKQQTAELIEKLADQYEQSQENPWQANGNYPAAMLNAIVGFEITVQDLQGKVKIGQNKSTNDLIGVVEALQKKSSSNEKKIATHIKNYLKSH